MIYRAASLSYYTPLDLAVIPCPNEEQINVWYFGKKSKLPSSSWWFAWIKHGVKSERGVVSTRAGESPELWTQKREEVLLLVAVLGKAQFEALVSFEGGVL